LLYILLAVYKLAASTRFEAAPVIPKLIDPHYCLEQAKELAAQAESVPNGSVRGMLLRVSRSYAHLATFAEVDQRKKAAFTDGIRRTNL
jgi:hypothetical protein